MQCARAIQDAHDAASHLTGVLRNEPQRSALSVHMSPPLQKQQRPIPGRQKVHRSILVIAQQWELRLLGSRCAFANLPAANGACGTRSTGLRRPIQSRAIARTSTCTELAGPTHEAKNYTMPEEDFTFFHHMTVPDTVRMACFQPGTVSFRLYLCSEVTDTDTTHVYGYGARW